MNCDALMRNKVEVSSSLWSLSRQVREGSLVTLNEDCVCPYRCLHGITKPHTIKDRKNFWTRGAGGNAVEILTLKLRSRVFHLSQLTLVPSIQYCHSNSYNIQMWSYFEKTPLQIHLMINHEMRSSCILVNPCHVPKWYRRWYRGKEEKPCEDGGRRWVMGPQPKGNWSLRKWKSREDSPLEPAEGAGDHWNGWSGFHHNITFLFWA